MELFVRFLKEHGKYERAWLRVKQCPECYAIVAEYQIDLHEAMHRHPSQSGAERVRA
jgi:hypothetical protein